MDQKKQIRNIIFLIAIMVFTFYILLEDYSIFELFETLKGSQPLYLVIGFDLMLLFIACEALNIKMISKAIGKEIPYRKSLGYSWIGFYFSSITPSSSGGQPAQVYYMKKDQISVTDSVITLFFIIFVYQIAMVLFGGTMAILNPKIAYDFANRLSLLFLYGIIMNVGAIFFFSALMFSNKMVPSLINFGLRIGFKLRLIKDTDSIKAKITRGLDNYHEKANILKKHGILFIKVLAVTVMQMAALNMVSSMVYLSMGYREHSIFEIITSQSLLTISISAVPLPGSVGAAEGGFLQAYTNFIPAEALKSVMIVARSISFYLPLIISFIIYIAIHLKSLHNTKQR